MVDAHNGLPQPPPEFIDRLRASCSEHGDYYADKVLATLDIQQLVAVGADDTTVEAQIAGDPTREQAYADMRAAASFFSEAVMTPVVQGRMSEVLRHTRTSQINPLADDLSDRFISYLGRRPDCLDTRLATMHCAFGVALARRRMPGKPVVAGIESALVNQFGNALIAKTANDKLCFNYAGSDMESRAEEANRVALAMTAEFNRLSPRHPLDERFLSSKLLTLLAMTYGAINMASLEMVMPPSELDSTGVEELRQNNTQLAHHIQRIRSFGVKSLVFSFGDVIPGIDAVYHNTTVIGERMVGEQPMAIVKLVDAEWEAAAKLDRTKEKREVIEGSAHTIRLGEQYALIHIDSDGDGELYSGLDITTNSMPLRVFFEQRGQVGKYEELRGAMLARLFDAVAPAEIVERLEPPAAPRFANSGKAPPAGRTQEVVNRMVLPRRRYFESQTMGRLREEFRRAFKAEEERVAIEAQTRPSGSGRRLHEVPGFTRKLPVTSRGPSVEAIKKAKEYWGEDYELPPGRTFVESHNRGSIELGRVLGQLVVSRYVPPEQ